MKRLTSFILAMFCLTATEVCAQSSLPKAVNDSLWAVWNNPKEADTSRLKAMHDIAREGYLYSRPDSAFFYAQFELDLARKAGLKSQMAGALNTQGGSFYLKGDYDQAMKLYQASLKMSQEAKDNKAKATAFSNIGLVNRKQDKDAVAIEYYEKALQLQEEIVDEKGAATSHNNIAGIYYELGDISRALDHYDKSLRLREKIGDRMGMAYSYGNIGNIHVSNGEPSKALEYFQKGLAIGEELVDKDFMANANTSIANIYVSQFDYPKALEHYNRSLSIYQEIGNRREIAGTYVSIASIYYGIKNFPSAIEYCQKGLEEAEMIGDRRVIADACNNLAILTFASDSSKGAKGSLAFALRSMEAAKQLKFPQKVKNAAQTLTMIYRKQGRYKEALAMFELEMTMRDSIVNEENKRDVMRQEMQYKYDKKEALMAAEQEKKDAIATEELKRKNQQRNAFIGGFALTLGLAGVSYRSYRRKKRDNTIITAQKNVVEAKNHAILESITYARKLQEAVLPPVKVVKEFFADSFLLYQPRDIVSGDFYWMESKNGVSYFALGDCTGHGVPGAMLSVMGLNGLNRALNELNISQPADFLTQLTKDLHDAFLRSDATVRDGMDLSICALDASGRKLTYAGANNPLWIARKGEMLVFKPNKRPVGFHDLEEEGFSQVEIALQEGDIIYLMTDGYADQLGGPNGLKMMTKVFRERLMALSALPLPQQRENLIADLNAWRGDNGQTDDICVMAMRV